MKYLILLMTSLFFSALIPAANALENIESYYDLNNEKLTEHAALGDPYALYILGERYDNGDAHTQKDEAEADRLFREAVNGFKVRARANDTPSMLFLGMMYQEGHGLPANTSKALGYYVEAAELGDVQAYELIKNTLKADDAQACEWIQKNAVQAPALPCEQPQQ